MSFFSLSYSLSLPHYCMCRLHLSVSISCPFSSHHLDFLSFPLIYSPLWRFSSLLQPKFQGPKQPSNFANAVGSIHKANRHLYLTQEPLRLSQGYGFSSGHVWVWELDCEESWAPKNWCFWTVMLEKTLESPLDCKEIPLVHPKGDQSWVFTGRTDAEAETPILWPPHVKSWLIEKDPDSGRDWGQEEKGTTEDEMAGWHHRLDGHGFGSTPEVGDGQGGLASCDSWGHKESDMTEWLKWTEQEPLTNLKHLFLWQK